MISPTSVPPEALEKSGEAILLDAALNSMPYGFSVWDDDYRLLLWNQPYLEIYGMPGERFYRGMTLREVCEITIAAGNHPGVTVAGLLRSYSERLVQAAATTGDLVFDKPLGSRLVKTTYSYAPGRGCVVTHEDVTESRQRETALSTQNLLLDAALNSMAHGFCVWDRNFRLVLWNREFLEIYALHPDAVRKGASLASIFIACVEAGHFEGRSAGEMTNYYKSRFAGLAEGASLTSEEVLANGRSIKVTYRRMPDGSWVATHEDVTAQKDHLNALRQREQELQHQNMRFEAAVDNMSQGLCMFDKEQKLVICNKRYADLYSLPQELVLPGTALQEILKNRIARGIYPVVGSQVYVQRRIDMVTERKEATDVVELRDGRVISVLHHPMSDGGWVSTHQDITEQRRNEARIRHLARHDALTDLPNRMVFRERMEAAEARIRRGEKMAVLCIDLDHFKAVNDLLGHAVGDAVLRAAAERLVKACRPDDIVARLGGDEFAILHGPLNNPEDAAGLADRVVKGMAEPFDVNDHRVTIGASVGIAVAPNDGADAETLMKNADLALYRAKGEGRGGYHFFERGMDAALQERLALEIGLRGALANGELSLVFQPLFSLKENQICGMEALLRWHHPERGAIPPSTMIPIAEDTGMIVQIGEWVLRQACAAAVQWPDNIRIAVNLSPVQFKHRNLPQQVLSALAASGLAPDRLELEVTETVLLADNELTLKTLHQLRDLGVRISMDDFGTGYSSLSYLRSFPFDKIKIDQSFVRDIATREDSLAIIRAVIGLGRSLGIATTAEGVETEDQLDLVRQQGCTEVQGFLFSPPLPASAAAALFTETRPSRAAISLAS
jgi:diguanylate cyclase (GGDEF)-like protein